MNEWDNDAIGSWAAAMFAGIVANVAHENTGMEFVVAPVDGGPAYEVVTSNADAIKMEYGNIDTPGGSWSVKALLDAERRANEHARSGV